MLYSLYEWNHIALAPMRTMARAQAAMLRSPFNPAAHTELGKITAAAAAYRDRTTAQAQGQADRFNAALNVRFDFLFLASICMHGKPMFSHKF